MAPVRRPVNLSARGEDEALPRRRSTIDVENHPTETRANPAIDAWRRLRGVANHQCCLGPVLHSELLEDVPQMFARGVVTDAQQDRYLGTGLALPDKGKNLRFAIAEAPSELQAALFCCDGFATFDQNRGVLATVEAGHPNPAQLQDNSAPVKIDS